MPMQEQESPSAIVVFGEALVDDFGDRQVLGGAPFNVARHLAAFGRTVLLLTRVGADANGERIREECRRFGLSTDGVQVDRELPTGRVVVERSEDGASHQFTILPHQAYDAIELRAALAAQAAVTPAMLYYGTLAQRTPSAAETLACVRQASPARRYLDLNVRAGQVTERCVFNSLHAADIVKVNEEELRTLFGWYTHTAPSTADVDDPELRQACATLLRVFRLEGLIVTLGPRGALWFGADGESASAPAPALAVPLVDTVGAGDAFSAIVLLGRACGWPLALTLARANEFAGAMCGIAGAVPADLAFYRPFAGRWLSA